MEHCAYSAHVTRVSAAHCTWKDRCTTFPHCQDPYHRRLRRKRTWDSNHEAWQFIVRSAVHKNKNKTGLPKSQFFAWRRDQPGSVCHTFLTKKSACASMKSDLFLPWKSIMLYRNSNGRVSESVQLHVLKQGKRSPVLWAVRAQRTLSWRTATLSNSTSKETLEMREARLPVTELWLDCAVNCAFTPDLFVRFRNRINHTESNHIVWLLNTAALPYNT